MFTIRVYGLWIHDEKILLCKEKVQGRQVTKFPGGGLEYGEGTTDCLLREFREELHAEIHVLQHFYTTDFFVENAFRPGEQVLSIYYLVSDDPGSIEMQLDPGIFFFWKALSEFSDADVDLVIDRHVAGMLSKARITPTSRS